MANKFTRFLKGAAEGLLNPKGVAGNWTHATKIFVDNTFRLSPRNKFLFYVRFEIDKTAHKSPLFTNKHNDEVGLLVKSADLPKYSFDVQTLNQYNRKRLVHTQVNYLPVSISMHDDNAGVTNALWALYYGYYVADRKLPEAAYSANHYRNTGTAVDNFRYGLDNNISTPFLKSISIYTMSKKRFLGYTLINPRISSWNHTNVAYGENDTAESNMTVEYEAVKYSTGFVRFGNPKGFAELHYDALPSPLSIQGGGVASLFGQGGVIDGAASLLGLGGPGVSGIDAIFGEQDGGNAFESPPNLLGKAIIAINTIKSLRKLTSEGVKSELLGALALGAAAGAAAGAGAIFNRPSAGGGTDAAPKTF
jgi:hypothetical protein